MSIYKKLRSKAAKLLKKFGESPMTLTFHNMSVYDPVTGDVTQGTSEIEVYGVLTQEKISDEKGETFKREQPVAIVSVPDTYSRLPAPGDTLTHSDGTIYNIEQLVDVKPGTISIVWRLWIKA